MTQPSAASVILGIETATPAGGVALCDLEGNLISQRWSLSKTGFSRRLMPSIDSMMADCGLDVNAIRAIAVSRGPGGFTGVRVGLTTAKTLAQALGVPLYLESTLEALASRWPVVGKVVCAALDARRSEFYSGVYRTLESALLETVRDEKVESCSALLDALENIPASEIWFSGDGATLRHDEIEERLGGRARFVPSPWNLPAADIVALRGARAYSQGLSGVDPYHALPNYLRASDAERGLARQP